MPIKINKKNKSKRVEILRVGNFKRRFEDDLKITSLDLEKMKQNFESNARRQEFDGKPVLPFNFSHDSRAEAAGWITGLEIDNDEKNIEALFADVEWTEKGAQKIKEKEFKFVSSEFAFNMKDNETGKIFDIILGGAALTNIPFIRDMEAVQLSENENGRRIVVSLSLELSGDNPDAKPKTGANMPKIDEVLKKLSVSPEDEKKIKKAITEDNKQLSEKADKFDKSEKDLKKSKDDLKLSEKELETLKTEMAGSGDSADALKLAEGKIEGLDKKVSSLTKTLAENAKKSGFDVMLSEGKVCEAQRKPFMENDMATFAKNAQEVKLNESGKNSKGDETMDGAEEKAIKLAEAKMKEDKNLDYGGAMKIVLSENSDLKNKLGQ